MLSVPLLSSSNNIHLSWRSPHHTKWRLLYINITFANIHSHIFLCMLSLINILKSLTSQDEHFPPASPPPLQAGHLSLPLYKKNSTSSSAYQYTWPWSGRSWSHLVGCEATRAGWLSRANARNNKKDIEKLLTNHAKLLADAEALARYQYLVYYAPSTSLCVRVSVLELNASCSMLINAFCSNQPPPPLIAGPLYHRNLEFFLVKLLAWGKLAGTVTCNSMFNRTK